MKKITLWMFVLMASLFLLAACGGGGGGEVPIRDCRILEVKQVATNGFFGDYELTLNFADDLPEGQRFYKGNIFPNRGWDFYPVDDSGKVLIKGWLNGGLHESSYGVVTADEVPHWVDNACSSYAYPPDAKEEDRHLGIVLGETKVCKISNTGDDVITAIESLGGDLHRIYINPRKFSDFAMRDYQKLSLFGQQGSNDTWVDHPITDAYPCFYSDVHFLTGATMEFSFYVIKADGKIEWIDPTLSAFQCKNHLCISF